MNNLLKMNLEIFGENDKDFFTNAYKESYNIGEEENTSSEDIEATENGSDIEDEQTIVENEEKPENVPEGSKEEPKELTPEEVKALYEQYYGQPQEKPIQKETPQEVDEQTKSAIELYKFLEENPHLVQAMREVDQDGYKQLNNYIPDEMTRKLQEFEEYMEEQKFNAYLNEVKSKYSDFDEEKVLEYAEKHEVYDLEIAYKAMKAEQPSQVDEQALREQIKKELLEELKQNSLSTQTIIGTQSEKPLEQQEKITLSAKQNRIANAMGMSAEEYAKWI